MPQAMELPCVYAMAGVFEPLLQQASQRQVHIVAAQQDVIADRDALERQLAAFFRNRNQAEVRRAAADVAYENQVADFDLLAPALALAVYPCVKSGLRLFE